MHTLAYHRPKPIKIAREVVTTGQAMNSAHIHRHPAQIFSHGSGSKHPYLLHAHSKTSHREVALTSLGPGVEGLEPEPLNLKISQLEMPPHSRCPAFVRQKLWSWSLGGL